MTIIYSIAIFLILLIIFAWGIPSVITTFFGAPWSPTPPEVIKKSLRLVNPKKGNILYDLGSGYGSVLVQAAKYYKLDCTGLEIDPIKVTVSRVYLKILKLDNKVNIIHGNIFHSKLSDADVVFCYLLQPTNNRLKEKLKRELKPGTKIISHSFTFPGWKIIKSDDKSEIYLYVAGKSY